VELLVMIRVPFKSTHPETVKFVDFETSICESWSITRSPVVDMIVLSKDNCPTIWVELLKFTLLSISDTCELISKTILLTKLPKPRIFNQGQIRRFADAKPSEGLKLTFAAPHTSYFSDKIVESVLVPGLSGDFVIHVDHVPTIAELRPGLVTVTPKDGAAASTYFVSGGFAFVAQDSTCNVNVVEAARLEDLDPDATKEVLRKYESALGSAKSEEEIAAATVGIETAQAILTGSNDVVNNQWIA